MVDHSVLVLTNDGRVVVGTLRGYDQATNLALEDCHERVFSAAQGVERVPLGLYFVRGDNVLSSFVLFLLCSPSVLAVFCEAALTNTCSSSSSPTPQPPHNKQQGRRRRGGRGGRRGDRLGGRVRGAAAADHALKLWCRTRRRRKPRIAVVVVARLSCVSNRKICLSLPVFVLSLDLAVLRRRRHCQRSGRRRGLVLGDVFERWSSRVLNRALGLLHRVHDARHGPCLGALSGDQARERSASDGPCQREGNRKGRAEKGKADGAERQGAQKAAGVGDSGDVGRPRRRGRGLDLEVLLLLR
jgi:small nuclear ribonucleoprotein (snRNP)-like protein